MTIDFNTTQQAGLARREVRSGERDGLPTKIVVAGRRYPADQADVWDAISNPERLPRWFLPVTGEFRRGGRYQLEGNAGGLIERCEAPELVAVTWEFYGAVSWVEVQLTPDGDGTLLELRHETHIDSHWEQYGPGAVGVGWDLGLLGLAIHLDTGAPVDPKEAARWSASEEGTAFISRSSDGWTQAAIANGEESDAARSAGAQVTAFYTAQPDQVGPNEAGAE